MCISEVEFVVLGLATRGELGAGDDWSGCDERGEEGEGPRSCSRMMSAMAAGMGGVRCLSSAA